MLLLASVWKKEVHTEKKHESSAPGYLWKGDTPWMVPPTTKLISKFVACISG